MKHLETFSRHADDHANISIAPHLTRRLRITGGRRLMCNDRQRDGYLRISAVVMLDTSRLILHNDPSFSESRAQQHLGRDRTSGRLRYKNARTTDDQRDLEHAHATTAYLFTNDHGNLCPHLAIMWDNLTGAECSSYKSESDH